MNKETREKLRMLEMVTRKMETEVDKCTWVQNGSGEVGKGEKGVSPFVLFLHCFDFKN